MLTRGSAIAEGPRVSGTLHWRLSKQIICSCTVQRNESIYKVPWLETRVRAYSRSMEL